MTLDLERFRLRTFLDALHDSGQLDVRDGPIDLVDVAAALEGNPRAVLFRKVGPEGWDLAGNVTASRERLALAFGTSAAGVVPEVQRRLGLAPEIVEVSREQAPVQQIVMTGDEAKAGFDLTLPFGSAGRTLDTLVPEPPRFDGTRFPSIDAALADGPKTFEALMAATGTRDGREIVLRLEALRSAGRLTRDHEGRYMLDRG